MDSTPPVLPPRPGGRTRPVPAALHPDEIYDDCEEQTGGEPPNPEDTYDDFEAGPPPLPPHPEEYYDDIGGQTPPPPPQRPKPGIPLMTTPPQEEYDDCGPIVQQLPKKRPQPPPPVTVFNPANTGKKTPEETENVYELGDDDAGNGNCSPLPPPPPIDDGPVYEVEPNVDDSARTPPPPPPPLPKHHPSHPPPPPIPSNNSSNDVAPPPPSRPASHQQAAKPQAVVSPKGPPGGFAMNLELLQNAKDGLKRVSQDNGVTSPEASPSHDSKMYGSPPDTVYDAKKLFENKSGAKPGPLSPKPQLTPKPNPSKVGPSKATGAVKPSVAKVTKNASPPSTPKPQQAVAPVSRADPQFDEPDDIYDDASSTVIDPLMKHDWYHGSISRPEGDKRVKDVGKNGAFLVRVSEKDPKFPYTLVVWHKGSVNNLRIRERADSKVALGDEKAGELAFTDVPAMIDHHRQNNVVLLGSNQSNVKLQHSARKS